MKIYTGGGCTVELTYIDLCGALIKDVTSDKTMPDEVKNSILGKLKQVAQTLEAYSA